MGFRVCKVEGLKFGSIAWVRGLGSGVQGLQGLGSQL